MIHSNDRRSGILEYLKPLIALFSLCVTVGLTAWALTNYRPVPNLYGPRAIYSLIFLSVFLSLMGRILLLRLLRQESANREIVPNRMRIAWRSLFLIDVTAPCYLAAGVLIGVPAAVLTAVVTQVFLQGFTLWRGFVSWQEASYRIGTTALLVLIADSIYNAIGGPPHNYTSIYHFLPLTESREFLGSILGALVMMALILVVSFPILAQIHGSSKKVDLISRWQDYLRSPIWGFQLLVLSVGPLLPVVDIFDDKAGELAWIFFLVPLFAIYSLALNTTRLSVRTSELQRTLEDLSSARRRQDELRGYASLITRVQEEERRRLARELHDDTAQALIALSLGLDGLNRAMSRQDVPKKDRDWLASLQNLADHTLEGVRRACRDLRPSVLDDLGLRAALEWLCDTSASRGVPCTFACLGVSQSTTPEAEIAIFRIVQEALSNIWRHSEATQAHVELRYLPDALQLTVHDNGKGFTPSSYLNAKLVSQRGLGLVGMRERAMLVGATLTFTSSPGAGCSVELHLPLPDTGRTSSLSMDYANEKS
ncbi:MAG TPA: sensor histidine kinase [Ktedonobacteraceae bacterium]|nr:sensor histidine kinase [Ktedonobacteraceae bacterium]